MRGAIAAFVKTPGLSPIKTRLAEDIGKQEAERVFLTMVKVLEEVLQEVDSESLDIYWAVGEVEGLNSPLWKNFNQIHSGYGDLGHRLHNVYLTLLEEYDYVIVIGSDSPHITPDHINCAVDIVKDGRFVFGPTFDGGFYLFGGSEKIPEAVWTSVEYSTENTMNQLSHQIELLGDVLALEPLVDVDTVQDLAEL